jgi:2-polyprenyl-6-methoxyphenol hydroxylase-like FAD-dependent oxidoreductase
MTEHGVVIAGGGPTGLMLAGELALARVDVAIVERRESQDLAGLRAGGLHPRTTEVLDQRGIADRFVSQGQVIRSAPFAGVALDVSDLPTRHNYFLALWQTRIERILADWVGELAVPVYRGCEVTGFAQDDTGVEVALSDGRSLRAKYLVGCDGGRSLIRKKAGIDFPGWDPSTSYLIAEVEMAEEPEWGIRRGEKGINAFAKIEDGKRARASSVLPRRTRAPGRRRGTRAFPSRWTGTQHRCPGCGEPGMEARPGSQRDIAREPPGVLPCRAAPSRCPRVAQHHGANRARPR